MVISFTRVVEDQDWMFCLFSPVYLLLLLQETSLKFKT